MLREVEYIKTCRYKVNTEWPTFGFPPNQRSIHLRRNGGLIVMDYCLGDEERVIGQDKGYDQPTDLVAGEPAYESNQRRYIDAHLWIYLPL